MDPLRPRVYGADLVLLEDDLCLNVNDIEEGAEPITNVKPLPGLHDDEHSLI